MKNRLLVVFAAIIMLTNGIAGHTGNIITRHYGIPDGMTHTRVRDIVQDSRGYVWFATWCGVERFDGYEFRNFRTYSGDSIKLDNNRIEHIAESPDGNIAVETYGHRIYRLDAATGIFTPGERADSLALQSRNHKNRPHHLLENFYRNARGAYVDRSGNLWIIRDSGVDYFSIGNPAFNFIDSTPIDSIGEDIHAVYAAPDGKIWTASRDTRVMLYDSDGSWLGNLSSTGTIVKNQSAGFGKKAYAFHADSLGRIWIGTKSKELALLTPDGRGGYGIARFAESDAPGGLRCADIYTFATDREGQLWLGTFGNGVAKVTESADGHLNFHFPDNYPVEKSARVRRLVKDRSGMLIGATTSGVIAFGAPDGNPDEMTFKFTSTETHRSNSLSNDDILDISAAADGKIYFSSFSGGIDWLQSADALMDDPVPFSNMNIHTSLNLNLVLSVIQDKDRNFWVVSPDALSLYSEDWNLKSIYNATNLGRKVRFTEAQPQRLPDGQLIFGRSGGILIVDPGKLAQTTPPPLLITGVEAGGKPVTCSNNRISLPDGVRDIAIHLTAIDFTGAENIGYAYRLDPEDEWTDIGRNRVLRLSSLGAGMTTVQLRSTDANGVWCDNAIAIEIDVPRTNWEIVQICLIVFGIFSAAVLAILGCALLIRHYNSRRRLAYYIRCALTDVEPDETDLMAKVCHIIRENYGDAALKVESMAQRLNVGRNVLRREVKARIGISLEDFLRMVRVRAAADLLSGSSLTVSEIAYRCGFKSPQYMSMVFKENMGCTPTEYAGQHRKKS